MSNRNPLLPATLAGLLLVLVGCGGGGGASGPALPLAGTAVVFPPGYATTPAASITVRGITADPAVVLGVAVQGVAATSTDGFATWTAEVPLTAGENILAVAVTTAGGQQVEAEARVRREMPFPADIREATYDRAAGVVYAVDREGALTSINLATGARTILHASVPSGPLAVDETTGLLYLSHVFEGKHSFIRIDPATGIDSVLSENGDGNGPDVDGSSSSRAPRIDVDPLAGVLLVAVDRGGSGGSDQLVGVDLQTGTRSILAAFGGTRTSVVDVVAQPGSGTAYLLDDGGRSLWTIDLGMGVATELSTDLPSVHGSARLAIDVVGNRALSGGGGTIRAIDLTTGVSSLFSDDASNPAALAIRTPASMRIDASSPRLIVVSRFEGKSVQAISLASAERSVVHDGSFGSGPIADIRGIAVLDSNRILVSDEARRVIHSDVLGTAVRTTLTGEDVGTGPALGRPLRLAVAETGQVVYVIASENSVLAIDLATGGRRVITSAVVGSGALIDTWSEILCTPAGRIYVLDDEEEQILEVDPLTGNRSVLTGNGVGFGPQMGTAGMGYDPVAESLYVCGRNGVLLVDVDTGERSVFLDGATAFPAAPLSPNDLAFAPDGSAMYFTDDLSRALFRVDMTTKAITVIHDPQTSPGLKLRVPDEIVIGGASGVALVEDSRYDGVCAVDLTSGEAVLIAR